MKLTGALHDLWTGFRSLLTGLRLTGGQALQRPITVPYPHATLKMPERFRGHIQLLLDPETGRSRCSACGLCVRACPSGCLEVEGVKREGEKKKSVSRYQLDFTTCSLCGSCVEICPSDAIGFSKDYNVVSLCREDFSQMDLMKRLEVEAQRWAQRRPAPEPTNVDAASLSPATAPTGAPSPAP